MTPGRGRFRYQPALDGVRGVAVAMVLVFHAGFGWLRGGYLGVSVFFTLSGYLITSLALGEHATTGRLDVGAFYGRRIRRLLPASLVCVVAVAALAAGGAFDRVPDLRRDLWAAIVPVYNWVALAGGTSYQEQVNAAGGLLSPLDHYWSLAIEEQFYWVWPLVLALVLPRLRRASQRVAVIGALTGAAVVAAPLIAWRWGPDAAYWATPARLGEILVGAALAVVTFEQRRRGRRPGARTWWWAVAGAVAVVAAAITWPAGRGPAYSGWLPVFALASAALIAGLQVESPLRRALSWRPLVALGVISYGVYLFHWPVYAVVHRGRLDLPRPALFGVRVAITLVLATVSYLAIERPVRLAGWSWRPVAAAGLAGSVAAAFFVVTAVPAGDGEYWLASAADADAAALAPVDSLAALRAASPASATVATPAPVVTIPPGTAAASEPASTVPAVPSLPTTLSRPVRILVFGDSTAAATGAGLVAWAADHPRLARVTVEWAPACGFLRSGTVEDRTPEFEQQCAARHRDLPADLARVRPDVVVLMSTRGDLDDRTWDADEGVLTPLDPRYEDRMVAAYHAFVGELEAAGVASVAWVVPPPPAVPWDGEFEVLRDPERNAVMRRAIEAAAAADPDHVQAVDLATWDTTQPGSHRPDGLHYSREFARVAADRFLAPTLIAVALS